jgi:ABC-type antimicrobial peptide transport system permease subunit
VRGVLAAIDPELPAYDVRTMEEWQSRSLASRRTAVLLSLAFGILALFLSAVGIYGMLAYSVTLRGKEIGIRAAVGCTVGGVFAIVLREGASLIAAGILWGLLGVQGLRWILASQLYGVGAGDPGTMVSAVAILAIAALSACLLPARRATRVDPAAALTE